MENIRELIEEFCNNQDYEYREYSGIGMFGKECAAIVCGEDTPLKVMLELFVYIVDNVNMDEIDGETIQYELGTPCEDNMGKSSILYFPEVEAG